MQPNRTHGLVENVIADFRCFPPVKIKRKRASLLMNIINLIMNMIGRSDFMFENVMTVGKTIYVMDGWDNLTDIEQAVTVRQELMRISLSTEETNLIRMIRFVGLTTFSYEQKIYEETMRAAAEYYSIRLLEFKLYKKLIINRFSKRYRKRADKWYDKFLESLT